jgi:hypothetical protein
MEVRTFTLRLLDLEQYPGTWSYEDLHKAIACAMIFKLLKDMVKYLSYIYDFI